MAEVVTFVGYTPPPRYDAIPWTEARIEESASEDGTFTQIDVITLTPDVDPALPADRSFTTELGAAVDYWYRIVWADATSDTSVPTSPVQNVAGGGPPPAPYASVAELARILKIRAPTPEQEVALERVLDVATLEVNTEIDFADDAAPLTGWALQLVTEVVLERAVEHWRQQESPFGLIGLGPELPAERIARDSWWRHAAKLAPLKQQWGLA